jgi:hypothetical protein
MISELLPIFYYIWPNFGVLVYIFSMSNEHILISSLISMDCKSVVGCIEFWMLYVELVFLYKVVYFLFVVFSYNYSFPFICFCYGKFISYSFISYIC